MNRRLARSLRPVAAGAGCMILLLSTLNAMTGWRDDAPAVGDLISFETSSRLALPGMPRLNVETADGERCTIDLATLHRVGGSLLIEGQPSPAKDRFLVRWIGARTASDDANCGADRSLVVDRQQLDIVALAAAAGRLGTSDEQPDTDHDPDQSAPNQSGNDDPPA